MEFDFTGSCNRYIDTNGYSIRIGNHDMALEYRPEIQLIGANLCLMAVPAVNAKENPKILIGTGKLGRVGKVQKIMLGKSWQVSRRLIFGKPLGHVYVENKQSIALASKTSNQSRSCND